MARRKTLAELQEELESANEYIDSLESAYSDEADNDSDLMPIVIPG